MVVVVLTNCFTTVSDTDIDIIRKKEERKEKKIGKFLENAKSVHQQKAKKEMFQFELNESLKISFEI